MTNLPITFPRVPLKKMDSSMLVFELDRETHRLMPEASEMVTSAATMASFLHRNQTRMVRGDMPRVPYIEHPLRVALRLIRWGVRDAHLITAALLHDVVEDCASEIMEIFGKPGEDAAETIRRLYDTTVGEYVDWVTNPTDGTSYQHHIVALVAAGSPALLIKASDLVDNAGSLPHQYGQVKDSFITKRLGKYRLCLQTVVVGLGALPTTGVTHRAAERLELVEHELAALAERMAA